MATQTPRYEITASKYRPKTFDELAGQEFVVSTIKNSLKSGHIAPAYLFSGPRGCGKTSAARILARSLNCEKGLEVGPCGTTHINSTHADNMDVCDSCKAISGGASMDVLEIDGASNNSVNDVRQIKDEVLFPPQSGRYKVYIIDEVHMLSSSAFNALLKTIEEPPPYICFIFATTEIHKVPATIKSRCQQFNFRLISIEIIQGLLKKICTENNIQAEEEALFWIARESTGSMRDAFTLFDQVVSFSSGNIRSDLIREKLGIIGLEKINALSEACVINDVTGAFTLTDEILDSGVAVEQFIIDLAGYYRGLLLLKNGVTRESVLGYRSSQFSAKTLEALDSIRLEQALDILLDCYRDIRYSISPRFEIETAISKLTWLNKWVSPVELKESIDNARHVLINNSTSGSTRQAPKPDHSSAQGAQSVQSSQSGQSSKAANNHVAPPEEKSFGEAFRRMVAARDSVNPNTGEDEDVPLWDSAVNKNSTEAETYPQVEQVRSIIPGTKVP